MGLIKQNDNGESFEVNITCDHVMYLHFCPNCKNTTPTNANIKLNECPTCGNKKLDDPKPSKCTYRENRIAITRIDANGKKRKESDNALIKKYVGIDPDKLSGNKYYCPTHRGLYG